MSITFRPSARCWFLGCLVFSCAVFPVTNANAWGNEGHEIVGEIAMHYLQPAVRQRVMAMLAADIDPLTAHDLLSETTWADRFRDSDRNSTKVHYDQTRLWHFVDIELTAPSIDAACFNHPQLPAGSAASLGPASDCVVDKINEFSAELGSSSVSAGEKLLALKFLLHFIGDVHQPLHASDENDSGGNAKHVSAASLGSGTLHGFWDTQLVGLLGVDPIGIGDTLSKGISSVNASIWSKGTATDWALESFAVSKSVVYAKLPRPNAKGVYVLPSVYTKTAREAIATQLSRAGVRLAAVLNQALTR
jgi:hypothetical protein